MIKRLLLLTLVFCAACRSGSNETHYAEVEKHRQEQAAQPSASVTATVSPSPTASATPSPGQTPDTATATSRNYWTNFRGPKRDGKYEEAGVATNWPAGG